VGKTFLAQILGWRACQANVRVLFTTGHVPCEAAEPPTGVALSLTTSRAPSTAGR
jgi:hypothetical protein